MVAPRQLMVFDLVCQLSRDFSQKNSRPITSLSTLNSPIQDYTHTDDHNPPTYEMNLGFKSFSRH